MNFTGELLKLQGPPVPRPAVTDEEIQELRAVLAEMDGHLTEELMLNLRIEVERVITWENRHEIKMEK